MSGLPKISNPFEDETDFIDSSTLTDAAKQATQTAGNIVMKQVIKPAAKQVGDDSQDITNFLYGIDAPASPDTTGDPAAAAAAIGAPDASIEQLSQGSHAQQAAAMQHVDPDQKMASSQKAQMTDEQMEEREKARLHQRNYYTMGNKLDDIGFLEEQIAKVRQEKEKEEEEKRQEEEEKKEEEKQKQEEESQQLAPPSGKKTGVPQHVQREQNKAENKTGFSG